MEMQVTNRGFRYTEFTDRNGTKCSLQESSLATEPAIWFGASNLEVKEFTPGRGWNVVELSKGDVIGNQRMHLTQEQVRALLPMLQRFAETGEL